MIQRYIIKCLLGALLVAFWSSGASAACLSKAYDEVPQISTELRGQPHQIIAADEDVAAFQAKGFEPTACSGEFADRQIQLNYRNRLCTFVAVSNEFVEMQMERALGAPPALLCSSAEKVLGRWSGEPPPKRGVKELSTARIIDDEGASVVVDVPAGAGDAE